MSGRTLIHSARLVTSGRIVEGGWVLFEGGQIAGVGEGDRWPGADAVTDARGRWLTPGFIDIHGHGGGGTSFDSGTDGILSALALHRSHGTTRSVLSLVTAALPDLERQLGIIADAAGADPLILGSHLEGPFLDDAHRGAHDPALLRPADRTSVDRLLAAADDTLVQITLAPEMPGGMDALRQFVDASVVVAVGHCAADYDIAMAAFDAGASILTHAFNAMPGIHHRAPGPVAAAMDSAGVTLEVINDGVHVHPAVVRLAFEGAAGRIALITDAMAATGSADGHYRLGTLDVTVTDGVARLADGGSIAGSTLTLDTALRLAVSSVGLPVEVAVRALTETPARAIGREKDLGQLALGFAADAVLLDADFTVQGVWGAGRPLT
ncbi:N-acetylglucosamine-6-phosphate deacetylase [Parafrigoribacterium mesophilum]|uniref:N-acetylglucosamine-6-phosphate deacetylase n=1 Tax=Parafrigoribacterium mesophilum TaxID=433646 RepID=UPI0031FE1858